MPWWLEVLKKFIPELKVNSEIKDIKFLSDINVDRKSITYIDKRQITIVNPDPKMISEIAAAAPSNMEDNDLLFEDEPVKRLDQVITTLSREDIEAEIQEFRGIVPRIDIPILEAAIVIKNLFENGQPVARAKSEVVVKYGDRGNMICNLYTAGYFHTLIIPASRDEVNFPAVYEVIVTESPLAMFVGYASSEDKIKAELLRKIAMNQEVGISSLRIHGIGQENIRRIRRILNDQSMQQILTTDPVFEKEGNVATVTIFF